MKKIKMMKNEVFITVVGIALILFLFLANQAVGMAIVAIALILYNSYCAYNYKGMKSVPYAAVPIIIFVAFMALSSDKTLANIMMFAWLGSMVYFAMNADTTKPEEKPMITPTGKFCSGCGTPVELDASFCKACGAKL